MKKLSFVLGFAGGILALIFALAMIYTVPANLIGSTIEDIKYNMKNENIVALNEIGIYAQDHPITDYSESALIEYSEQVAENSEIFNDKNVYEDTVVFAHSTALHAIISTVLIGVSVIFALIGFIGALAGRKGSTGTGVVMLVSSLVLLLCAIYTGTVLPMAAACALLAGAGVAVFIPARQAAGARRARRVKPQPQYQQYPMQYQQYQQYPQQPYQPQAYPQQYPQQPFPQQAPYAPPAPATAPAQSGVPFPDEELQVFAQPADTQDIKE